MDAWRVLEPWVRAGRVDMDAQAPATIAAASVTLRLDGSILGRGSVTEGTPQPLHRAAEAAIAEALSRIPENSAVYEQIRSEALARALISVELAGPMIPITLATYTEADLVINPGLEGVAVRFGERIASAFPEWMLATGMMPGDGIISCIAAASGDPTLAVRMDQRAQPRALAREHGAVFYRFRTTHLAQTVSGGTPRFMHRSDVLVRPGQIDGETAPNLARDLASWLIRHDAGSDDASTGAVLGGNFDITTNRLSTTLVFEQALAALALVEYAAVADQPLRDDSLSRGHDLVLTLITQPQGETPWTDPVGAALTRIAMIRLAQAGRPVAPASPLAVPQIDAAIDACWSDEGWAPKLPDAARSIIAAAMAERAVASGDGATRARAEAMVRSIYRDAQQDRLVGHMPWLGRAEVLLAGDQAQIPAAVALRGMRDQVWRHQVTFEDAGQDDADMLGGIVFTAAPEPRPTWHSIRPAVFLAQALGDPRLTDDDEVLREVSRLTGLLRFVDQLSVGEGIDRLARSPTRAEGGIRAALWQLEQPPEATALGLMFLADLIKSQNKAMERATMPVAAPQSK